MKFFRKNFLDFVFLFLICLTLPLFFYKLGQSSLISWDEAWYGTIAKNMLKTGDIFHMVFNNATFFDTPPGGIWPIALAYKLLGVSEFTTRLPSALAGFGSLILTYFLGKKIFNREVGLISALALCSSTWFLLRSRLGDLDTPLVFFYLLTFYFAFLAQEKKKFFLPFCLSLGYLTTIKASLPFAIIPALFILFWSNKLYKLKDLFLPICSIGIFFGVWLCLLYLQNSSFVYFHFLKSSRNASLLHNNYATSLKTYKDYLHNGIGKWFWPGIISVFLGVLFKRRTFLVFSVFFLSYSLPLLTSPNLEIWHLIPLYPVMILSFFGLSWLLLTKLFLWLEKRRLLNKSLVKYQALIVATPIYILGIFYSFQQINQMWIQNININAYHSDEEKLASLAKNYSYSLTIDDNFVPAALFYSDKKQVAWYSSSTLKDFFEGSGSKMIITYQWRLEKSQIDSSKYQVLGQDRDKLLVLKK